MADPLSVTASIVSITAAALHSFSKLQDLIGKIKDAPSLVAAIKMDLENVDVIVSGLRNSLEKPTTDTESEHLFDDLRIQFAVKTCGEVCGRFESTLMHWIRHSKEDKMHWWDRIRAGYFGEEKIKAFTAELGTCKATVSLALEAANL